MGDAGRIRHHLKHNLWRRESTVLFVGYQAEGTLGRQIVEGAKKVKLFGEEVEVAAEVKTLPGVSGHADRDGLIAWLKAFSQKPARVFVNHGDDSSCRAFVDSLKDMGYDARAPFSGAIYDLAADAPVEWPEGVPALKARQRAKSNAFARLLEAVNRLMRVARGCEGMANKELAKFTSQIDSLADKWER